jgi:hypothetical protein
MIPDRKEILSSLQGAWLLVRRQEDGMRWLNLTAQGFWRSFFAAVLILPLYVPFSLIEAGLRGVPSGRYLARELAGYVLVWVCWPLALLALCWLLARTRRFAAMVIASNWVSVPEFAILAGAHLIALAVPPLALIAILAAIAFVLTIEYFVARTALDIGPAPAVGVVTVNLLVVMMLNLFTSPPP